MNAVPVWVEVGSLIPVPYVVWSSNKNEKPVRDSIKYAQQDIDRGKQDGSGYYAWRPSECVVNSQWIIRAELVPQFNEYGEIAP